MNSTRLYMFQTGTLQCKENAIKMNVPPAPYEIPVPWYLLRHPKGDVVIDGSCAAECALDPKGYWGDATAVYWPVMAAEEGCVAQLAAMGIAASDVRYVIQSHLHMDHTGAIGRFPNARHIVTRREYEYAHAPDWYARSAYILSDIDRPNVDWLLLDANDDGFDLFGDGVLTCHFTPGHAPGHMSFRVTLPHTGHILLTVDAAYTQAHWDQQALPGFLDSASDAVRSVARLRMMADRDDALVVTGHDPVNWPTLRHAPDAYE